MLLNLTLEVGMKPLDLAVCAKSLSYFLDLDSHGPTPLGSVVGESSPMISQDVMCRTHA